MTSVGVQTPRPSPARVRSHRLSAPTVVDVQQALDRSDRLSAEAEWAGACAATGLDPSAVVLDLAELAAVTAVLAAGRDRAALVGRAMGIRIAAYQALAAESAVRPAPAWDWARESTDQLLRDRVSAVGRARELLALAPFAPQTRGLLNRSAASAAHRLEAPVGLVTVALDGALVIVGSYGLDGTWLERAGGMPIEWSFCARLVRTREPYVLPDAARDVLARYNPLVVHDGAAAYAEAPMVSSRGEVLGACCVIGMQPRAFTAAQVGALEDIAEATMAALETARLPDRTPVG